MRSLKVFLPVIALLVTEGCGPSIGPRHLGDMRGLWIDAAVPISTNGVLVLLKCDWHASGGCAQLGSDFHATMNGVDIAVMNRGTISENGACVAPAVMGFADAGSAQLAFVVSDSSKQVEFDVEAPFAANVAVIRCVGATRCMFAGPLATATLAGTP